MAAGPQRRVALTGASGFVGSHVDAALRRAGCEVHVLGRAELASSVSDLAAALRSQGPIDVIVHLAAAGVSPKPASGDELRTVNVELPARIVAAAATAGVARMVMAGTAAEYGASADEHDHLPADAPLRPISIYARSKAEGLARAVDAAFAHEVALDHLRVFNAYGAGQDARALWPALHDAAVRGVDLALSAGTQVRDFIPVEAVADVFTTVACEAGGTAAVRVRNVGTGEGTSVRTFAERWWAQWRATGTLRFGALPDRDDEPHRMVADDGMVAVVSGPVDVD
jgi:UDP-glucose 4-epimerase